MTRYLLLLLAPLLIAAQSRDLPPAQALPPPDADVANVLAPVEGLLAAIGRRDGAAALGFVRSEGVVSTITAAADGKRSFVSRSWANWASSLKTGPERYEERLIGPAVEVEGDVAMVWARYDFLIDGKLHHCGFDHFDLVRDDAGWKILNLTWSSRTTDC